MGEVLGDNSDAVNSSFSVMVYQWIFFNCDTIKILNFNETTSSRPKFGTLKSESGESRYRN